MNFAVEWLKGKPLTLNLIKQLHSILMESIRGRNKGKGEFRTIQNWIGKPGCTIEEASYVPPAPLTLQEHLGNFEKYIHFEELDKLIQLAIVHAQFEIIHPFLDGNGRLGRMLIPLFLFEHNLLYAPMFYISEYLEAHREEYYYHLNNISSNNDWNKWIEFFLNAVINQAQINITKAKAILTLYEQKKKKITEVTHSQYCINIIDALFKMPIFNTSSFVQISDIPKATAIRLLKVLDEYDIISKISEASGRKPALYVFNKLYEIIK